MDAAPTTASTSAPTSAPTSASPRPTPRTRAGLLAPALSASLAGGFIILAVLNAHQATWLGMDKTARILIAGLSIFVAVATEMIVLRQKKLVGNGQIAQAVVDEVRSLPWSKQHSAAYYHFFTEDRRVITSFCAIENAKKDRWSPGQTLTAIYDPARPVRHVVNDRPWAVQIKNAA